MPSSPAAARIRAIDLPCTECGAREGDPCHEKPKRLNTGFAPRPIKSIHPVRYEDAQIARDRQARRDAAPMTERQEATLREIASGRITVVTYADRTSYWGPTLVFRNEDLQALASAGLIVREGRPRLTPAGHVAFAALPTADRRQ